MLKTDKNVAGRGRGLLPDKRDTLYRAAAAGIEHY